MNAKRRWYELLLPILVVFLVLMVSTVKTVSAYEYIDYDPVPYGTNEGTNEGN